VLVDTRRFALINDAYLIQYLDELKATGSLDLDQKCHLTEFVLTQIRNRIVSHTEKEMFRSVYLTPPQLYELERTAALVMRECDSGWDLIEALLSEAARLSGCAVWGWKCPPDYLNIERILAHFPQARFIFVIRDPFRTMRSYKNWPWRDGRSRYHPLIQATVWRSVVESFQKADIEHSARILMVRFEDLIGRSQELRWKLANFVGPFQWPETADVVVPNTSMKDGSRELTWVEWSICKNVTNPYLRRFGYDAKAISAKGVGVFIFLLNSVKCCFYYITRALYSRDMRNRLKLHMASLLSRAGSQHWAGSHSRGMRRSSSK
jgi:hypothetical protein